MFQCSIVGLLVCVDDGANLSSTVLVNKYRGDETTVPVAFSLNTRREHHPMVGHYLLEISDQQCVDTYHNERWWRNQASGQVYFCTLNGL